MEKERILGFDVLRVLACYMVIQVHAGEFFYIADTGTVLPGNDPFWVGWYNSLCRSAVPLFVMMTGTFLLPVKTGMSQFLKKRFTRVIVPFIVWCILYALYKVLMGQSSWGDAIINIIHIPVNWGVEIGHLWYIYMLIGLYLFAPVISPWLQSASRKGVEFYLYIWAFTLCVPYIHLYYPEILGECFWNQTPMLYYFSGFLGYAVLAWYARTYWSEKKAWNLPVGILLIVVGYIITAGGFESRLGEVTYVSDLELTWGFETVNVGMMTLGLYLCFKNMKVRNSSSAGVRIVTDISVLSYGIYLIHIMVLNLFYALFNPVFESVVFKIPCISVCTFIVSYLIIKIISYLPKSKYLIG